MYLFAGINYWRKLTKLTERLDSLYECSCLIGLGIHVKGERTSDEKLN